MKPIRVTFRRAKGLGSVGGLLLLGVALASPGYAAPETSLVEAARQAIAANLDLATRRQALAAARQEIDLARAPLLPQVKVGARAQALDSKRSDAARGNNKQKSILAAAGLNQMLYDEGSWADFDVQKHVYEGQVKELDAFELVVIQDAANAFLELDRSRQLLEIQKRNRGFTRRNLETSRSRIAAGWSSEREILRWEAQLASNDASVRAAEVSVLQNRLELNRVRNLPPEAAVKPLQATIDEYGFVYARPAIAKAVLAPGQDRRMRDFLASTGLRRSPDLAALDASIAAAERQLTAHRRAFWVPTLSFGAGVDHLVNHNSGDDFDQTEWGFQGVVTFPLLQGGAKFAGLEQARESLASLRTQRLAAAQQIERTIRSAFGRASGSFENVSFSRRQVEAAKRNFDLVDRSYTLGVASILDLLDAQSQLLQAKMALNNATYGFLGDLVAAERAMSFYTFLQPPSEVEELLDELEQQLSVRP